MTTTPPVTKTARGTPRQRRPRAIDIAMRAEGWVTAAEVAGATGLSVSSIINGIRTQRIPGKGVVNEATFGRRTRWYVNLRQYIVACGRTAPSPIRRALWQLSKVADVPDEEEVP